MTAMLVIKYIRDLDAYTRSQLAAGINTADTLRRQVASVSVQIDNLPILTMTDANELSTAISESVFNNADQATILQKLDDRAQHASGSSTDGRGQQISDGHLNYYTQADWDTVRNASRTGKIDAFCTRQNKWGIGCPSERLCGSIGAAILVHGSPQSTPTAQDLHDMKTDVHNRIKTLDAMQRAPLHTVANIHGIHLSFQMKFAGMLAVTIRQ